ncbi:MAG: glycosyltransferase [Pseudomonadota bacterium]
MNDLRVGLVTWDFPLVSETFVINLAADLLRSGVDLRVLALDPAAARDGGGPGHDEALLAPLRGRVLRAADPPSGDGGDLRRRALRRALALAGAVLPAERTATARLLANVAPFDVLHCQFGTLGLGMIRPRRLGLLGDAALLVHLRGYDITTFVRKRGPDVYAQVFREADLLIANCGHFRDRAVALGADPDAVRIIGSPIDGDFFAPPAAREPYGDRPLRLVAVGRLVEKKGFADAIAATGHLVREGRSVELTILGEGALRPDLEHQVADLGLGGVVRLPGAAGREAVRAALHNADIALAPSVTAESGDADAPVNTLKEAMATEMPVVATTHGGIPELVIPGENGALVPERDPAALARAVADLADRPDRWAALGAAGRRKTLEDFASESVLRRTLAAYAEARARRQARRESR